MLPIIFSLNRVLSVLSINVIETSLRKPLYISENRLYVYAYTRDELLKVDNLLVFINLQFFSFFKFYEVYVEI